jgi:phage gp46-like protein
METALNPQTGDYTNERITTLGNAIYLRLMTPLGTYWANRALGSRLHELAREKDLQRVRILAEQYARTALQPLLDSRRASAISVTTVQPHDGRLLLLIEVTDAGGLVQLFEHPVKVL